MQVPTPGNVMKIMFCGYSPASSAHLAARNGCGAQWASSSL